MQGAPPSGEVVLDVRDASVRFGGVRALDGVTCHVNTGEICGLIGPNGAGKTTLFNCITRLYQLDGGTIAVAGRPIADLPARRIISLGVARTFQNIGIYPEMTVLENTLLGAHHTYGQRFFSAVARPFTASAEERRMTEACRETLRELDLIDVAHERAGNLPYGTLKRVEIARAVTARPRLLLLDEPAAGLNHGEREAFADLIRQIRDRFNLTVLLVEHNMGLVMGLCSRILVLHLGKMLAEGAPSDITSNPDVVNAYLGQAA